MTREEADQIITTYRTKKGGRHVDGLCGHMASLCYDCFQHELEVYRRFAASKPAPQAGEPIWRYWQRIGGEFGDAWYQAAAEKFEQAGITWV